MNIAKTFGKDHIIIDVWFFKKIKAIVINKNAGNVIHNANNLAEVLVTLSLGI